MAAHWESLSFVQYVNTYTGSPRLRYPFQVVQTQTAAPEDLLVDEFFSTVPGKNFDLCIIPTRSKTHQCPSEKLSTSSEVPQNHNDLPSTRSQALLP